jgi:hypothetical protein
MNWSERQIKGDWVRGHFTANIVVAAARPGLLLHQAAEREPAWAIRPRFAAGDPLAEQGQRPECNNHHQPVEHSVSASNHAGQRQDSLANAAGRETKWKLH